MSDRMTGLNKLLSTNHSLPPRPLIVIGYNSSYLKSKVSEVITHKGKINRLDETYQLVRSKRISLQQSVGIGFIQGKFSITRLFRC